MSAEWWGRMVTLCIPQIWWSGGGCLDVHWSGQCFSQHWVSQVVVQQRVSRGDEVWTEQIRGVDVSKLFLVCYGLVVVEWAKYSLAGGQRLSWGRPWDDWGQECGEDVDNMDTKWECRGWLLLLLKSKLVLDSTVAVWKYMKKVVKKRVRARASVGSSIPLCYKAWVGHPG